MSDLKRWRGMCALITDAVEHGATAVERVHLATARRPFAVLARIPGVAQPAQGVQRLHDAAVSSVYASIRGVNRAVGATLDIALEHVERGMNDPGVASSPAVPDGGDQES